MSFSVSSSAALPIPPRRCCRHTSYPVKLHDGSRTDDPTRLSPQQRSQRRKENIHIGKPHGRCAMFSAAADQAPKRSSSAPAVPPSSSALATADANISRRRRRRTSYSVRHHADSRRDDPARKFGRLPAQRQPQRRQENVPDCSLPGLSCRKAAGRMVPVCLDADAPASKAQTRQ